MRTAIILSAMLAAVAIPTMMVSANNACPDQNVHNYGAGGSVGAYSATAQDGTGAGIVTVTDTNTSNCNAAPLGDEENPGSGVPDGDWDGDYDWGVGGAFFGYGTHAETDVCDYDLNVGGGHVEVNDAIFGNTIAFVTAENDQDGPIFVPVMAPNPDDPTGPMIQVGTVCETDGNISPGTDLQDDDCISVVFIGSGNTCGTGGGDGGFWVFLSGTEIVESLPGSITSTNPPTSGTITRS